MLRLPEFCYHQPKTVAEAVAIAADHGSEAVFVAGGTDLYPNMKRRQQTPAQVISLAGIAELRGISGSAESGLRIGAMVRLCEICSDSKLRSAYPAVAHTADLVASPLLRNMGTLGGNLLLDTRCSYYNQSYEWRESIDFCLKCAGDTCWVAPSSPRCWAVQSSDSLPLLSATQVLSEPGF